MLVKNSRFFVVFEKGKFLGIFIFNSLNTICLMDKTTDADLFRLILPLCRAP